MPSIDFPLAKLVDYRPALTAPDDFDDFWRETLAECRRDDLAPVVEPLEYPLAGVRAHRLSYAGYHGHRIHGLYLLPAAADNRPAPTLIVYHGYSGGAGLVHQHLPWVMLGCGVIAVDTRGQGGETGDPEGYSGGSSMGWMTQGILNPRDYYYRRAYCDCVRAVDFAHTRPELDNSKLAVTGGSQGGGLSLAVAGLDPRVLVALPDVPFLCHFDRALDIALAGPYQELQRYAAKYPRHLPAMLQTLAYHDGMNLASRINPACRMLWSVGLWDDVCPPSTVYAAYNHCPATVKQIEIYPYNKHEGGGGEQVERKLAFLKEALEA